MTGALKALESGESLSEPESASLASFLESPDSPLSGDDKEAITRVASASTPASSPDAAGSDEAASSSEEASDEETSVSEEQPESDVKQTERFLKIKNETDERLDVWLQYRTEAGASEWSWFPTNPESSNQGVHYVLEPGEETFFDHQGNYLTASRVRIWARSSSGEEWNDFKDTDLWLVDEIYEDEHCYFAEQPETHTFTLQ